MIKVDEGMVNVNGNRACIMAEAVCLLTSLEEILGEEDYQQVIKLKNEQSQKNKKQEFQADVESLRKFMVSLFGKNEEDE